MEAYEFICNDDAGLKLSPVIIHDDEGHEGYYEWIGTEAQHLDANFRKDYFLMEGRYFKMPF